MQSHPHIIPLYQVVESESHTLLFLQLAQMSLREQIDRSRRREAVPSEESVSLLIKGVLSALEHLHLRDIVHRDLKPDNLLLCSDGIKLADFGLSVQTATHHRFERQQCGTVLYMAPELLAHREYHKPVDLWSTGIIVYELLTNHHPFPKEIHGIANRDTLPPISNRHLSPLALDFFYRLVNLQPSERYSADMALQHPWITRNFDSHLPLTIE